MKIAIERGWIGWDNLQRLLNRIPDDMGRSLGAVLFLGGFRVSEALQLTDGQVFVEGDFIKLDRVRLLKKWRYTDAFDEDGNRVRERLDVYTVRVFPIDEPIVPYFTDWMWEVRRRGGGRLYDVSRFTAYRLIREHTGLFPHFFRSLRAIQLVVEYGWSAVQLRSFFNWENMNTVFTYAGLGASELAKAFPMDRQRLWRR